MGFLTGRQSSACPLKLETANKTHMQNVKQINICVLTHGDLTFKFQDQMRLLRRNFFLHRRVLFVWWSFNAFNL